MDNTPIKIDLSYLYSLTGGNKSFEQKLLSSAVVDVNKMVERLQESWNNKEVDGIRKSAHSLISLSAIAGMPAVESWSRKIEKAFEDGRFHPELEDTATNIISGWPSAYLQLQDVIAGN